MKMLDTSSFYKTAVLMCEVSSSGGLGLGFFNVRMSYFCEFFDEKHFRSVVETELIIILYRPEGQWEILNWTTQRILS